MKKTLNLANFFFLAIYLLYGEVYSVENQKRPLSSDSLDNQQPVRKRKVSSNTPSTSQQSISIPNTTNTETSSSQQFISNTPAEILSHLSNLRNSHINNVNSNSNKSTVNVENHLMFHEMLQSFLIEQILAMSSTADFFTILKNLNNNSNVSPIEESLYNHQPLQYSTAFSELLSNSLKLRFISSTIKDFPNNAYYQNILRNTMIYLQIYDSKKEQQLQTYNLVKEQLLSLIQRQVDIMYFQRLSSKNLLTKGSNLLYSDKNIMNYSQNAQATTSASTNNRIPPQNQTSFANPIRPNNTIIPSAAPTSAQVNPFVLAPSANTKGKGKEKESVPLTTIETPHQATFTSASTNNGMHPQYQPSFYALSANPIRPNNTLSTQAVPASASTNNGMHPQYQPSFYALFANPIRPNNTIIPSAAPTSAQVNPFVLAPSVAPTSAQVNPFVLAPSANTKGKGKEKESVPLTTIETPHQAVASSSSHVSSPNVTTKGKSSNALIAAVEKNDINLMKRLLNLGDNINSTRIDGASLLYIAAERNNFAILKSLVETYHLDINQPRCNGATPLFAATKNANVKIVEYLISHGADTNKPLISGVTPLLIATLNAKNKKPNSQEYKNLMLIRKKLLDNGAILNLNTTDSDNISVIDLT